MNFQTDSKEPDVIVRIPLGESEAAVIPIGALRLTPRGQRSRKLDEKQLLGVGSAVVAYEDANFDPADNRVPSHSRRLRKPYVNSSLRYFGDKLEIEIFIGAGALGTAVDKIFTELNVTALMPDYIEVLVMTSFKSPPWNFSNFSGRGAFTFNVAEGSQPFHTCALAIIPNGVEELKESYVCAGYDRGQLLFPKGGDWGPNDVIADFGRLRLQKQK